MKKQNQLEIKSILTSSKDNFGYNCIESTEFWIIAFFKTSNFITYKTQNIAIIMCEMRTLKYLFLLKKVSLIQSKIKKDSF